MVSLSEDRRAVGPGPGRVRKETNWGGYSGRVEWGKEKRRVSLLGRCCPRLWLHMFVCVFRNNFFVFLVCWLASSV